MGGDQWRGSPAGEPDNGHVTEPSLVRHTDETTFYHHKVYTILIHMHHSVCEYKKFFNKRECFFPNSDLLGCRKNYFFEHNCRINVTFLVHKFFDINESLLQVTCHHFSINAWMLLK